jgi:hypothetical protein
VSSSDSCAAEDHGAVAEGGRVRVRLAVAGAAVGVHEDRADLGVRAAERAGAVADQQEVLARGRVPQAAAQWFVAVGPLRPELVAEVVDAARESGPARRRGLRSPRISWLHARAVPRGVLAAIGRGDLVMWKSIIWH